MAQEVSQSPLVASSNLPHFSGTFSTDAAARTGFADDFGHQVQHVPAAVLRPKTFDDIVQVVQFARQQGLKVVPRGQGHSTRGQSQAQNGIVIDMTALNTIHAIHEDRVEVEAGALWTTLLQATLEHGLAPPVMTDYLNLSIGGVLSVGGVGGSSYRYGPVVDNVLELQVVTGEGQLQTCSATQQPELFESVLAGLGQCAIIVKATLRLIAAKTNARVSHLFYPDLATMIADYRMVLADGRFEYVVGNIIPTPQNTWGYMLEPVSFYTPSTGDAPDNTRLTHDLRFIKGMEQIEEVTYSTYANRVALLEAGLKQMQLWEHGHPWFDVFVPASQTAQYVSEALKTVSPIDFAQSPILLYGLHRQQIHTPLFPALQEETFFLFDILRTVAPHSADGAQAAHANYTLFEQCRAVGGTLYPIATIGLSHEDWQRHFGTQWQKFLHAKHRFDPDALLTPGQGIFS